MAQSDHGRGSQALDHGRGPRWYGVRGISEVEANRHLDHCFAILRYALMCDDSIRIKQVGWPATDALHSGTMDVDQYCLDPVRNGVEANTRG